MKIFVEAQSILKNRSGVGWFAFGMVKGLQKAIGRSDSIELISHPKEPMDISDLVNNKNTFDRPIDWLPPQIYHALKFRNIIPPVDLFFGKGVYIFPNFIRWPLARSKSVIVVHDLSMFVCPQYLHPQNLAFMTKHLPGSIKKADLIVAVSQASKDIVLEQFDVNPDKIVVAPLAAADYFTTRDADEIAEAKAKYGIFGDYILFVSTLEPRKNVECIIAAYRALPDKIRQTTSLVLIGGRGWQDEGIREAIKQARKAGEKVVLPGYVDTEDMAAMYSGAKAFLFPSHYEGFGLPILEAMSCGVPVITANNSSLPEAGGDAALYIEEATDVKALTDATKKVLTDEKLRQQMIKKGYKQAASFSWDNCSKVIFDAIKRHGLDK
ncbi:MAG TPA: glycosyltransferase family 1 protein [Candidatus Saccharimonadales bacterium]|nr:glycosyltransferase family 1 protein [Candidatus Saccharimonadales bacterium]